MKNKNQFLTYSIILISCILTCIPQTSFSQDIGLEVDPAHHVLFGESLTGAGKKLIWSPTKAAFRAGEAGGTSWEPESIGSQSTAFGTNNLVTASLGMSWGSNNEVSESVGTAWGVTNKVNGFNGTAWGTGNIASGSHASVWGEGNVAGGHYSTAWGRGNNAASSSETIFGRYAKVSTPTSPSSLDDSDQLFAIGNGTSSTDRQNALTVLKSGDTDIMGFVKLGSNAPAVQMVELTANTSASAGEEVTLNFPTGITGDKVLSISAVLDDGGGNFIMPGVSEDQTVLYNVFWQLSTIRIVTGGSSNIASRPVKLLVTYKE